MKTRWLMIFVILQAGPCFADCLDEQKQIARLEKQFFDAALSGNFMPGVRVRQWELTAHFYRTCYSELGLSRLQAEVEANKWEQKAANLRSIGGR